MDIIKIVIIERKRKMQSQDPENENTETKEMKPNPGETEEQMVTRVQKEALKDFCKGVSNGAEPEIAFLIVQTKDSQTILTVGGTYSIYGLLHYATKMVWAKTFRANNP